MPQPRVVKFSPKLKPLVKPGRYKGASGGRASGKSHFFASLLVLKHYQDPNLNSVCIREVQKSLKFSAKKLIENKIRELGLEDYFEILTTEIKRKGGEGVIIFQGMQDHTADSIKSLEGFDLAWVEEAQSLSHRSMELLLPTIRKNNSEIYFSWNPSTETDPVDQLFAKDPDAIRVHINFDENIHCPEVIKREAAKHLERNPETYGHIYLGEYSTTSDEQVLHGKWEVKSFEPQPEWDGPYYGLDFGFSQDPTACVEVYDTEDYLYIRREAGKVGLELDHTADYIKERIPGIEQYVIRADSARPESIAYLKKHGLPRIEAVKKWPGSVEDGITWMRSHKSIVIHPDCKQTIHEAGHYKHKIDRKTGDVLPDIIDADNHMMDGIRYACSPLIRRKQAFFVV